MIKNKVTERGSMQDEHLKKKEEKKAKVNCYKGKCKSSRTWRAC